MKQIVMAGLIGLAGASTSALAYDANDWIVKFGAASVQPDGDGALDGAIDVKDDTQLGLTVSYMLNEHWAVNLLAATPFTHDIELNGTKVGEASHLPPTLSLQYHILPERKVNPYVGAGINYTVFFDEKSTLGDLSLDSSVGVALELGVDVSLAERWGVNAAVWNMDIESDAKLDGNKLDRVQIDPWVFMLAATYEL